MAVVVNQLTERMKENVSVQKFSTLKILVIFTINFSLQSFNVYVYQIIYQLYPFNSKFYLILNFIIHP